jgi:NAD(P)-dependent dehydrogenase (short-subunit alcohol dehydrogenase family)
MELDGKTALITGASRGIGRAVALGLAEAGCHVALAARSADKLAEVADQCARHGARTLQIAVDLARDASLVAAVERCVAELGGLDILVNNAGVVERGATLSPDLVSWDGVLAINLRAAMHLTALAVPHMMRAGGGAIINIASISGKMPMGGMPAYSASKHGLVGFSGSVFEDVREHGIKVCAINPGFVDTEMVSEGGLDRTKLIQPADIAATVLFVLRSAPGFCPTEITLRPQRSPYK